jgi:hypothetical protein
LTPAQSQKLQGLADTQLPHGGQITEVGLSGPTDANGQNLPFDQAYVNATYGGGQISVSGPTGAGPPAGGYDVSVQNPATGEGDFSGGISRHDAAGAVSSSYSDLGLSTAQNNNATLACRGARSLRCRTSLFA